MDGLHLRLLETTKHAQIIQDRAARNARIDKLGVDRSLLKRMPCWERCVEAQKPERQLAQGREDVTFDAYLDAWRGIVKLPKATRTR